MVRHTGVVGAVQIRGPADSPLRSRRDNPAARPLRVEEREWPTLIKIGLDTITNSLPECVAIRMDAQRMAEEGAMPLGELRRALEPIPGFQVRE
jgi:hypothetical protein